MLADEELWRGPKGGQVISADFDYLKTRLSVRSAVWPQNVDARKDLSSLMISSQQEELSGGGLAKILGAKSVTAVCLTAYSPGMLERPRGVAERLFLNTIEAGVGLSGSAIARSLRGRIN